MGDSMTFPKTVDEFMDAYKLVDTEQVYSNGSAFVPIFRMKQWFEHHPDRKTEWILCKDQMPPMDTYVLAVLDDGKTITIAQRLDEEAWLIYEDAGNATDEDILAWMPLPSPPEVR